MKKICKTMFQTIGISSSITLIFIAANQINIGFNDVIGIYFFGAVCGLLSFIYVIESLPLLLQLLIHLGGSIISFIIVAYLNHWIPMNISTLIPSLITFVIIFLIIWFIFLIINIQFSKKVNTKLKKY